MQFRKKKSPITRITEWIGLLNYICADSQWIWMNYTYIRNFFCDVVPKMYCFFFLLKKCIV